MKQAIARVFIGGGRRYLTLRAACIAEARARVKAHLVRKHGHIDHDIPWPHALQARVAQLLEHHHRRTTP
jgi:hypothetical protein